MSLERELAVATDAARRAGRLQMERYERLERIVNKSPHDVVTEVDELSEELIIGSLHAAFPGDAFLAEESGASKTPASGDRVWVIDPLDGTVNYANGIPIFCVSIGLADHGQPVVGVVYDPTRDELFSAQAGRGARLDGRPIHAPNKEKLADAVVSLALPRGRWAVRERRLRHQIRVARSVGSAALALAYVANGQFDAFVQAGGLSAWDICAAGLIAAEGGATLTTLDGGEWFDVARPARSTSLIAASPQHHEAILALLQ